MAWGCWRLATGGTAESYIRSSIRSEGWLGGGGTCLLIPALARQKQEDLKEFEASLVYKLSSMTARTVLDTEKPCLRKKKYQEGDFRDMC